MTCKAQQTLPSGFVHRGGKLYNSVSVAMFKKGAKKWVTEQIPVRPGS